MGQETVIYCQSIPDHPLRQGEILSNLTQVRIDLDSLGFEERLDHTLHPYAIVVSQDCDLDWDYKARQNEAKAHKKIPNILFCEVAAATELHKRVDIDSKIWDRIKINKDERYHFFQQVTPAQDFLGEGLPELGVDFKRYFTIPSDEVYLRMARNEAARRCYLMSPYREHFSARFYYFQSRIALPEEHFSEPGVT